MAKRIKRTSAQSEAQKRRTAKNKKRKYTKLIEERPNDPHKKKWESKI